MLTMLTLVTTTVPVTLAPMTQSFPPLEVPTSESPLRTGTPCACVSTSTTLLSRCPLLLFQPLFEPLDPLPLHRRHAFKLGNRSLKLVDVALRRCERLEGLQVEVERGQGVQRSQVSETVQLRVRAKHTAVGSTCGSETVDVEEEEDAAARCLASCTAPTPLRNDSTAATGIVGGAAASTAPSAGRSARLGLGSPGDISPAQM